MAELTLVEAINQAYAEELRRDDKVFLVELDLKGSVEQPGQLEVLGHPVVLFYS